MNDDDACETCEKVDCECLEILVMKYGEDTAFEILGYPDEDYTNHNDYLNDEI